MRLKSLIAATAVAASLTVAPIASAEDAPTPPVVNLPGCIGSSVTNQVTDEDGTPLTEADGETPQWQTTCKGLDLSELSSKDGEQSDTDWTAIIGGVLGALAVVGIIGVNVYNQFMR